MGNTNQGPTQSQTVTSGPGPGPPQFQPLANSNPKTSTDDQNLTPRGGAVTPPGCTPRGLTVSEVGTNYNNNNVNNSQSSQNQDQNLVPKLALNNSVQNAAANFNNQAQFSYQSLSGSFNFNVNNSLNTESAILSGELNLGIQPKPVMCNGWGLNCGKLDHWQSQTQCPYIPEIDDLLYNFVLHGKGWCKADITHNHQTIYGSNEVNNNCNPKLLQLSSDRGQGVELYRPRTRKLGKYGCHPNDKLYGSDYNSDTNASLVYSSNSNNNTTNMISSTLNTPRSNLPTPRRHYTSASQSNNGATPRGANMGANTQRKSMTILNDQLSQNLNLQNHQNQQDLLKSLDQNLRSLDNYSILVGNAPLEILSGSGLPRPEGSQHWHYGILQKPNNSFYTYRIGFEISHPYRKLKEAHAKFFEHEIESKIILMRSLERKRVQILKWRRKLEKERRKRQREKDRETQRKTIALMKKNRFMALQNNSSSRLQSPNATPSLGQKYLSPSQLTLSPAMSASAFSSDFTYSGYSGSFSGNSDHEEYDLDNTDNLGDHGNDNLNDNNDLNDNWNEFETFQDNDSDNYDDELDGIYDPTKQELTPQDGSAKDSEDNLDHNDQNQSLKQTTPRGTATAVSSSTVKRSKLPKARPKNQIRTRNNNNNSANYNNMRSNSKSSSNQGQNDKNLNRKTSSDNNGNGSSSKSGKKKSDQNSSKKPRKTHSIQMAKKNNTALDTRLNDLLNKSIQSALAVQKFNHLGGRKEGESNDLNGDQNFDDFLDKKQQYMSQESDLMTDEEELRQKKRAERDAWLSEQEYYMKDNAYRVALDRALEEVELLMSEKGIHPMDILCYERSRYPELTIGFVNLRNPNQVWAVTNRGLIDGDVKRIYSVPGYRGIPYYLMDGKDDNYVCCYIPADTRDCIVMTIKQQVILRLEFPSGAIPYDVPLTAFCDCYGLPNNKQQNMMMSQQGIGVGGISGSGSGRGSSIGHINNNDSGDTANITGVSSLSTSTSTVTLKCRDRLPNAPEFAILYPTLPKQFIRALPGSKDEEVAMDNLEYLENQDINGVNLSMGLQNNRQFSIMELKVVAGGLSNKEQIEALQSEANQNEAQNSPNSPRFGNVANNSNTSLVSTGSGQQQPNNLTVEQQLKKVNEVQWYCHFCGTKNTSYWDSTTGMSVSRTKVESMKQEIEDKVKQGLRKYKNQGRFGYSSNNNTMPHQQQNNQKDEHVNLSKQSSRKSSPRSPRAKIKKEDQHLEVAEVPDSLKHKVVQTGQDKIADHIRVNETKQKSVQSGQQQSDQFNNHNVNDKSEQTQSQSTQKLPDECTVCHRRSMNKWLFHPLANKDEVRLRGNAIKVAKHSHDADGVLHSDSEDYDANYDEQTTQHVRRQFLLPGLEDQLKGLQDPFENASSSDEEIDPVKNSDVLNASNGNTNGNEISLMEIMSNHSKTSKVSSSHIGSVVGGMSREHTFGQQYLESTVPQSATSTVFSSAGDLNQSHHGQKNTNHFQWDDKNKHTAINRTELMQQQLHSQLHGQSYQQSLTPRKLTPRREFERSVLKMEDIKTTAQAVMQAEQQKILFQGQAASPKGAQDTLNFLSYIREMNEQRMKNDRYYSPSASLFNSPVQVERMPQQGATVKTINSNSLVLNQATNSTKSQREACVPGASSLGLGNLCGDNATEAISHSVGQQFHPASGSGQNSRINNPGQHASPFFDMDSLINGPSNNSNNSESSANMTTKSLQRLDTFGDFPEDNETGYEVGCLGFSSNNNSHVSVPIPRSIQSSSSKLSFAQRFDIQGYTTALMNMRVFIRASEIVSVDAVSDEEIHWNLARRRRRQNQNMKKSLVQSQLEQNNFTVLLGPGQKSQTTHSQDSSLANTCKKLTSLNLSNFHTSENVNQPQDYWDYRLCDCDSKESIRLCVNEDLYSRQDAEEIAIRDRDGLIEQFPSGHELFHMIMDIPIPVMEPFGQQEKSSQRISFLGFGSLNNESQDGNNQSTSNSSTTRDYYSGNNQTSASSSGGFFSSMFGGLFGDSNPSQDTSSSGPRFDSKGMICIDEKSTSVTEKEKIVRRRGSLSLENIALKKNGSSQNASSTDKNGSLNAPRSEDRLTESSQIRVNDPQQFSQEKSIYDSQNFQHFISQEAPSCFYFMDPDLNPMLRARQAEFDADAQERLNKAQTQLMEMQAAGLSFGTTWESEIGGDSLVYPQKSNQDNVDEEDEEDDNLVSPSNVLKKKNNLSNRMMQIKGANQFSSSLLNAMTKNISTNNINMSNTNISDSRSLSPTSPQSLGVSFGSPLPSAKLDKNQSTDYLQKVTGLNESFTVQQQQSTNSNQTVTYQQTVTTTSAASSIKRSGFIKLASTTHPDLQKIGRTTSKDHIDGIGLDKTDRMKRTTRNIVYASRHLELFANPNSPKRSKDFKKLMLGSTNNDQKKKKLLKPSSSQSLRWFTKEEEEGGGKEDKGGLESDNDIKTQSAAEDTQQGQGFISGFGNMLQKATNISFSGGLSSDDNNNNNTTQEDYRTPELQREHFELLQQLKIEIQPLSRKQIPSYDYPQRSAAYELLQESKATPRGGRLVIDNSQSVPNPGGPGGVNTVTPTPGWYYDSSDEEDSKVPLNDGQQGSYQSQQNRTRRLNLLKNSADLIKATNTNSSNVNRENTQSTNLGTTSKDGTESATSSAKSSKVTGANVTKNDSTVTFANGTSNSNVKEKSQNTKSSTVSVSQKTPSMFRKLVYHPNARKYFITAEKAETKDHTKPQHNKNNETAADHTHPGSNKDHSSSHSNTGNKFSSLFNKPILGHHGEARLERPLGGNAAARARLKRDMEITLGSRDEEVGVRGGNVGGTF